MLTVLGIMLYGLLVWTVGIPEHEAAEAHFRFLPGALASLIVAAGIPSYHWSAARRESELQSTGTQGARRSYPYALAAVGLVVVAVGIAALVSMAVGLIGESGAPKLVGQDLWRNALALSITLGLLGAPLLAYYWPRVQSKVNEGDVEERTSLARRIFIFGVLGVGMLVLVGSASHVIFVFLRELLEGDLSAVLSDWQRELADLGWSSYAIDLRGHGKSDPIDLSDTSMRDYADDVKRLVDELKQPPVIIGWSMGGLVAQMAATSGTIAVWVGLEPSPPVLQVDSSLTLRNGVFDSAEYGIADPDPHTQTTMPDLDIEERKVALASLGLESRRVRDERKRGIVIESVPCPFLVVNGTLSRDRSEKGHVERLASDRLVVEGASHWGLVLNRRALRTLVPDVLNWISGAVQRTQGA